MAASIHDVAKVAGVSVATVSRALRDLPNVAPSTKLRVLDAAAALNYVADVTATRLATGRTQTVGVAVTQIGQWFTTQVLSGVEAVLTTAGYDLLLLTCCDATDRQGLATGQLTQGRVDGLLAVDVLLDAEHQRLLATTGLPTVLLAVESTIFSCVGADNREGARAAVDHLLDLGHRRIGLVGGVLDEAPDFVVPAERRAGYHCALAARGIPADPGLEALGNFSFDGGAEAAATLLDQADPPTAVFALSDEMAAGALRTGHQRGIAVPSQLSVVGFDDQEMAAALGLTTVAQPVVEQARRATQLLLHHLADAGAEPARVVLPTRLVVRDTTAPPARRPVINLLSTPAAPSMIHPSSPPPGSSRG